MSTSALVILTTVGSAAAARKLVRGLVEDRLVACGTLLPAATSIYRWNGAMTEEKEVIILLKTDASRWDELAAAIRERHPYDVPELLALPVDRGSDSYLSWLTHEVVA
ncbi:MAG: divalent-cation tolerance protein CutA [Gemmatimonadales bacterium]